MFYRLNASVKLSILLTLACYALPAAAHAPKPDRYYHSPDSRISHHRPRHAYGGGNASVFCDRATATGGMNCAAMVFAHKTLRLGSTYTLCSGSRCVSARVVDRGPYVAGREFDLSPGLARALGVNGLGRVWRI